MGISVAGRKQVWKPGKCLIFDDSYEHFVWHNGEDDRVVLLFDVWHPDLTHAERDAISRMFKEAREKSEI